MCHWEASHTQENQAAQIGYKSWQSHSTPVLRTGDLQTWSSPVLLWGAGSSLSVIQEARFGTQISAMFPSDTAEQRGTSISDDQARTFEEQTWRIQSHHSSWGLRSDPPGDICYHYGPCFHSGPWRLPCPLEQLHLSLVLWGPSPYNHSACREDILCPLLPCSHLSHQEPIWIPGFVSPPCPYPCSGGVAPVECRLPGCFYINLMTREFQTLEGTAVCLPWGETLMPSLQARALWGGRAAAWTSSCPSGSEGQHIEG